VPSALTRKRASVHFEDPETATAAVPLTPFAPKERFPVQFMYLAHATFVVPLMLSMMYLQTALTKAMSVPGRMRMKLSAWDAVRV
jgi:hypothetical protein